MVLPVLLSGSPVLDSLPVVVPVALTLVVGGSPVLVSPCEAEALPSVVVGAPVSATVAVPVPVAVPVAEAPESVCPAELVRASSPQARARTQARSVRPRVPLVRAIVRSYHSGRRRGPCRECVKQRSDAWRGRHHQVS